MMDIRDSLAITEAIIFASGEPIESERIAEILEVTNDTVTAYVGLLNERYENCGSGIKIISINKS